MLWKRWVVFGKNNKFVFASGDVSALNPPENGCVMGN